MRGRAAAAALPVLAVVVLVAIVAVASTGSTTTGSGATRSPSTTLYDIAFTVGLVALALGGLLLLYGLAQRKAIQQEVATGRYRRTTLLGWVAFVMLFTAVFYTGLIRLPRNREEAGADYELAFPGTPELPTLPEGAETSYTPTVTWIPVAVVVALLLAGAAAYVISERRARRGQSARELTLAALLADVLDDTLDDLRAEADPRKAVVAAYARLELVLAANGAPRLASETPDEYLPRVLHDLELDRDAVARLTALFTRAKFSHHEVDVSMKHDAIESLEQVRDELRALREPSTAATGSEPAIGAAS